ncbi:MAG: hypothetical protein ABI859_13230 [Pseudomonadota bacterium]
MSGCARVADVPAPVAQATPAPVAAAPVAALTLPISLNAVMVSLVDASVRPVWSAATKPPKTDADWGELEYHAWQNMLAGTIIKIPGTGPADAGWVVQPEWIAFADQLTSEGREALAAAQTKDLSKFEELGNKIVATCEGCHARFKPELPTGKIMLRYP